jgi:hypothetical protein
MKDIQEYKDRVQQEFEDWYRRAPMETLTAEEISHVTSVGVSVLQTRDGGIPGGSFVQAIVKNDLSGSYNRADSTNRKVIPFYITLKDHVTI